ncbi:unnamed protein product [Moneuplotes crassus]|uniref:Uncharacterized protein n=2 Tax=Euplotes crassus TaxID=5936 RepID=A0AAD2DAU4_EUPCR|nr:unnamed protein product [Moneuplotes crassus]
MDFIVFKFHHDHKEKQILIRRDDVTLGYLRLQTRKVFKLPKNFRFALSYELIKPGHENDEPPNRHYYCSRPDERPDKLLMNDQQLAKIRTGRRKNHNDTAVRIIVHTSPNIVGQYYQQASPIKSKSIQNLHQKGISKSPQEKRNYRSISTRSKKAKNKDARIVKIRADNTYDYNLPPPVWEIFLKSVLNNPQNIDKLKMIYKNNSNDPKKKYNISDYINPVDLIVRKMENELGIQGREVKVTKPPSKEYCTCDHYDSDKGSNAAISVINHRRERLSLDSRKSPDNTQKEKPSPSKIKEIERKFLDVGYDSDDVFANNPSTLMGAKYKVVRKFEKIKEEPPKPVPPSPPPPPKDDICPDCKKPKLIDAISHYDTIQSKINGTLSINSDALQSPNFRRGKDTDSDTPLEKSLAERTHSVREPKKVIRKKRRKRKKKSQMSKASLLSTPRQCMRHCCIAKRIAEDAISSQRSKSSLCKSPQKFNFSSKAMIKSLNKNKLHKKAKIQTNTTFDHHHARTENASLLKEEPTIPSLHHNPHPKPLNEDPSLTYQQKGHSKQKLRFNLIHNQQRLNQSQENTVPSKQIKGLNTTLKSRIKISNRRNVRRENGKVEEVGKRGRKASMVSNGVSRRKYKKTSPKLLPEEFTDKGGHHQTYSVKQTKNREGKKIKHLGKSSTFHMPQQDLSNNLSNSNIEYSNYHQTIHPKSDMPKFIRNGYRKNGFKSTNPQGTRLPLVKNGSRELRPYGQDSKALNFGRK